MRAKWSKISRFFLRNIDMRAKEREKTTRTNTQLNEPEPKPNIFVSYTYIIIDNSEIMATNPKKKRLKRNIRNAIEKWTETEYTHRIEKERSRAHLHTD